MEIIVLFFGLMILGVMAFGAFFIFMFFRWAFFGDKIKEKKIERYKESLPERFNGADTVTWDLPNYSDAPTKDQLITDAAEYGYKLDHMASGRYDQTFVFKKDDTQLIDRVAPYLDKK